MNAETIDPLSAEDTKPPFWLQLLQAYGRFFRGVWRLVHRCFFSRRALAFHAAVVTLSCLAWAGYNWRQGRRWEAEKQRVEASAGSWEATRPKPNVVPDAENFFGTQVMKKLFAEPEENSSMLKMWWPEILSGRTRTVTGDKVRFPHYGAPLEAWCEAFRAWGTLPSPPAAPSGARELLADKRYDALLAELYAAAGRPYSRHPVTASFSSPQAWADWSDLRLRTLRYMSNSLLIHARACLEIGDPDGAISDVRVISSIKRGLLFFGSMSTFLDAASSANDRALLKEGMHQRRWNAGNLHAMLAEDSRPLLHEAWNHMCAVERLRACGDLLRPEEQLKEMKRSIEDAHHMVFSRPARRYWLLVARPRGWWAAQAVVASRYWEALQEKSTPLQAGETWSSRASSIRHLVAPEPWDMMNEGGDSRGHQERRQANRQLELFAARLVSQDVTRIIIRAELHRLAHSRYPASLEELDPMPGEVIPRGLNGEPFHYSTDPAGVNFEIWTPRRINPADVHRDKSDWMADDKFTTGPYVPG